MTDSKTAKKIEVIPCMTCNIEGRFCVTENGYFRWVTAGRRCGTEAEAQAKAAALRELQEPDPMKNYHDQRSPDDPKGYTQPKVAARAAAPVEPPPILPTPSDERYNGPKGRLVTSPVARPQPQIFIDEAQHFDEPAARVEQPTPPMDCQSCGTKLTQFTYTGWGCDKCNCPRCPCHGLSRSYGRECNQTAAPAAPVVEQRPKYPVVQHPGGGITNLESAIAAVKRESGSGWRYAEQVLTDWLAASQRTEGEGQHGK